MFVEAKITMSRGLSSAGSIDSTHSYYDTLWYFKVSRTPWLKVFEWRASNYFRFACKFLYTTSEKVISCPPVILIIDETLGSRSWHQQWIKVKTNDLDKVTGLLEGIKGCRSFLLSTISTYQTLGKPGIKLFYRALQLNKTFENPSNTAKVIWKTILLNHQLLTCQLTA